MGGLSKALPPDKLIEAFRLEDLDKVLKQNFDDVAAERMSRLLRVIESMEIAREERLDTARWRVDLAIKLRREFIESLEDSNRPES